MENEQIIVLSGNHKSTMIFYDGMRNLGMIPYTFEQVDPRTDKHSGVFADANTILSIATALLGSGGLVAIITAYLESHKAEGSIELDKRGNVMKVNFRNMKPSEVTVMVNEITSIARNNS